MFTQLEGRIAQDATVREVPTNKDPNKTFKAVDMEVYESGKDGKKHKVTAIPPEGLIQYLKKGTLVQVTGDFDYNLGGQEGEQRKYYQMNDAQILLINEKKKED
ncbi:MAG: hypothetical protein RJQ14_03730 [Marinoscillum sp.]